VCYKHVKSQYELLYILGYTKNLINYTLLKYALFTTMYNLSDFVILSDLKKYKFGMFENKKMDVARPPFRLSRRP
jgi:hypothetical protein